MDGKMWYEKIDIDVVSAIEVDRFSSSIKLDSARCLTESSTGNSIYDKEEFQDINYLFSKNSVSVL